MRAVCSRSGEVLFPVVLRNTEKPGFQLLMTAENTLLYQSALGWPGGSPTRHSVCAHEVQFYSDDEFLVDSIVPFLARALENGGTAIVIATQSHRESLSQRLQDNGIALAEATKQGSFVALDAAETLTAFMVDGLPDKARFDKIVGGTLARAAAATTLQNPPVAAFGEMVALLWQQGNAEAAIRLEQLWNELSRTHSFSLRCGYPLASFDREEHRDSFARICAEHHAVIPAEDYTALENENERLRNVARLQQTAKALETELRARRQAEGRTDVIRSQNAELTEEVRKRGNAEEELRQFTRRLLTARDEEQRSLARDLHENAAQLIAAMSLYFGALQQEKDSLSPRALDVVERSLVVAQSLIKETRKLSCLLHPLTLEDMGLPLTLREYLDQYTQRLHVNVHLEISDSLGRLPRQLETVIFRMVEEALANLEAGPGRSRATVRLSRSERDVRLEFQDYMRGTSAGYKAAVELNITGMRERARELGGAVQVTAEGESTLVTVTLPLAEATSTVNKSNTALRQSQ
jgi:signal transduction histidine kinase